MAFGRMLILVLMVLPFAVQGQWTKSQLPTLATLDRVVRVAADTFYISGSTRVHRTYNGGVTWTDFALDVLPTPVSDIHFFNSKTGLAAGDVGGGNTAIIAKTTNSAQSWALTFLTNSLPYPRIVQDLEFVTKLDGYAVATHNLVLKTTNGGNSWANVPVNVTGSLLFVKMDKVDHGYLVTEKFVTEFNGQSVVKNVFTVPENNPVVDLKIMPNKKIIIAQRN
jgi:photosystem II stability/assembly factor-like uncharacterized protein